MKEEEQNGRTRLVTLGADVVVVRGDEEVLLVGVGDNGHHGSIDFL